LRIPNSSSAARSAMVIFFIVLEFVHQYTSPYLAAASSRTASASLASLSASASLSFLTVSLPRKDSIRLPSSGLSLSCLIPSASLIRNTPSAASRLNFRLAKTVDFGEPPHQQGGCHEQEVYRAAYGRGTGDLRSDHQEGNGQVGETAAGNDLAQGRRRRAGMG